LSATPETTKEQVLLNVEGSIAEIVLSAPERRNALTPAMAAELIAALARAEEDPDVAVVIIRGDGGYFCAGADLGTIAAAKSDPARADAFAAFDAIYETFVRLGELAVPTIAAVRGGAVGAGLNLALAADARIVGNDARLLSGFLRIGVHPGGGHFRLLDRLVGPERAAALSLLGLELDGAEAARCGLALQSVPDAEVDEQARRLAAGVADPALVRAATRSWRSYCETTGVSPRLLVRAEQAAQMWSLRRGHDR
jgi:enoyl-CoA hydratase